MNLIEKLGLEKCKAIVDGAPEGSEMWRDMDSVCSPGEILYYWWFGGALLVHDESKGWIKSIYHDGDEYILDQLELLSDLKAQIDQHYYGQSEEKELEQYAILSQEKIEGGAVLVGGSSIQKMVDYQDVIASQQSEIDQLIAEKAGFKNLVKSLRSEFDLNGGSDQVERQIELLEKALRGEHE